MDTRTAWVHDAGQLDQLHRAIPLAWRPPLPEDPTFPAVVLWGHGVDNAPAPKMTTLRFTTNRWRQRQSCRAQALDPERWSFLHLLPEDTEWIELAACCQLGDRLLWDDHFGKNYFHVVEPPGEEP